MKRIAGLYWCLTALIFMSCIKEDFKEDDSQNISSESLIFRTFAATLENGTVSKTSLQDGANFGKVYWEKGDQITVLAWADGTASTYAFSTDSEGATADFTNSNGVVMASDYYAV